MNNRTHSPTHELLTAGGSFVFVQMDQPTIADYPVGVAASTPTYRYVYASYIDEPVVRKTASTGGTRVYFHRNQQYSVTAVTTSAGSVTERYAYSAYGEPTICDPSGSTLSSSAINNRYTYTGREWDATVALYHFRARWMSPKTGRFLGRDPIGFLGGRFSVIEYVRSNPERFVDPSGLRDNTVPGGQLPRDDRNDGNVFCTWTEMEGFICRRNGYPRDSFPCHQIKTGCIGITAALIGHHPTFTNGDFQYCFDKLDQAQKKQASLSGSGYCKGKDCNGKGSDPVIFGFTWNRNNGSLEPGEKPMQFCPACGLVKWNDERPQRCWIWDFGFYLEGPNVFCHANEGESTGGKPEISTCYGFEIYERQNPGHETIYCVTCEGDGKKDFTNPTVPVR